MFSDRRAFLKAAGAGAAVAASATVLRAAEAPADAATPSSFLMSELEQFEGAVQVQQETWDVSWTKKVTGKHKAMFDVPEIRDGVGIFRAGIWGQQYTDVLKLSPGDLSTVIVIRHAAIPLAMNHEFWATYGLGKSLKIKDEKGKKWTMMNPMLSTPSTNLKSPTSAFLLDKQLANGAIALGCNLAFRQMVSLVAAKDKLSPADARTKAKTYLVPGLIMQPSGIFANVMAEEAGCVFVNAV